MGVEYYLAKLKPHIEEVELFTEIDSTNLYALRTLHKSNKRLIIAKNQTNGQGCFGKTFYSYADCGLYFTLVLNIKDVNFQQVMMKIALAIVLSINTQYHKNLMIKWVNDIYENDKKVGGILIQQQDDYLVIGVGLNLYRPSSGYAKEIASQANYLFVKKIDEAQLLVMIVQNFFAKLASEKLHELYKQYSLVLSRVIYHRQLARNLYVEDINELGNLITRDKNKQKYIINSGGIELRGRL